MACSLLVHAQTLERLPRKISSAYNTGVHTASEPAVLVSGLNKSYGTKHVVRDLSFSAARGQITAVLGPNGAGKTTTIECCEGLRRPDSGTIRVLGHNPETDHGALSPRLGVMLQDGGLPTGVPAGEILRHVAKMYANPRPVSELIDRLGLSSFLTTTVRRLSGGQRQRLALATAIVGRGEVLFLDEPSAGMDPQSRLAVHELISELRADGAAIILTTHLMDEAEQLADHVVIIDRGAVIAEGTVSELQAQSGGLRLHTADNTRAAVALAGLLGREVLTVNGGRLVSGQSSPAELVKIAQWCADEDVELRKLAIGQASLAELFLELTGRELR